MLKVPSVLYDTPTKSLPPLVDSSVNDVLVKSAPFCNQSFFQMVDVMDPATVDSLLQNAPDRVVNWIGSGLFGGQYCGPMKSGVLAESSATVSRARWAGALSCWNVKKSPDTERMRDVTCVVHSKQVMSVKIENLLNDMMESYEIWRQ